ncbi:MAG TPA: hypothetical protein VHC90_20515 [Bryobacteraceae bacterium]|nr:hypothetical protein [Bryobacteraceae bacterium]
MLFAGSRDRTLRILEDRLKTLLPLEYQESYSQVEPVSMGSAGLKYDRHGKVAWDEIWGSFCDLAMAGGPPHKGTLLQPGCAADIQQQPVHYKDVVDEICRGIRMVTELAVNPSENPGWVQVGCDTDTMAAWLVRAIVMENVSAWREDSVLELPAGPHYRLEKEIKNVITVIAKTCHYFADHLRSGQQRAISALFREMDAESPLVLPAAAGHGFDADQHDALRDEIAGAIEQSTGLRGAGRPYDGWLGIACPSVRTAISMMRLLSTVNVLSRREDTTLYVPVNPAADTSGEIVTRAVAGIYRLLEPS